MKKSSKLPHWQCNRYAFQSIVSLALTLLFSWSATALRPSPTTCYAVTTIATVCSLGSCATTYYVDDYWCSRTPSSDTVVNPHYNNPADIDQNLGIDDFKDVVKTTDPCAYQFDSNDRLGSAYGGPNTNRPDHTGVDLQANLGDPVAAVAHGQIAMVGWQDTTDHSIGCGYRIIIRHVNNDQSVYCHLVGNSARFKIGDWVRAGTVIGSANSTGNSSGDHLHLIYWQGNQRIEYWNVTGNKPTASQMNGGC